MVFSPPAILLHIRIGEVGGIGEHGDLHSAKTRFGEFLNLFFDCVAVICAR